VVLPRQDGTNLTMPHTGPDIVLVLSTRGTLRSNPSAKASSRCPFAGLTIFTTTIYNFWGLVPRNGSWDDPGQDSLDEP
jgi:hypothetical protein